MGRWFVKDLADMTGTSVQTLHHYDRLGLLKPSGYSAKGYRMYQERDLLKLQQIIALKFFGFELKQIKMLLSSDVSMREHFLAQASFLEAKADALAKTSAALNKVIKEVDSSSTLPWSTIINLIEVYRMSENIENTWVKEILTHEELKQYVKFEQGLKTRFSDEEKENFHRQWGELVSQIEEKLDDDPAAQASMELAATVMKHINQLYGDEHANLRAVIWEKGFKQGKGQQHSMSSEMVKWLDASLYAYYSGRIYDALTNVDGKGMERVWPALMKEVFAGDAALELDAIHKLIKDAKVSASAKAWLKARYKIGA